MLGAHLELEGNGDEKRPLEALDTKGLLSTLCFSCLLQAAIMYQDGNFSNRTLETRNGVDKVG